MTPQDGEKCRRSPLLILRISRNMSEEVMREPRPPSETFPFWDSSCCYPASDEIGGGPSSSSA